MPDELPPQPVNTGPEPGDSQNPRLANIEVRRIYSATDASNKETHVVILGPREFDRKKIVPYPPAISSLVKSVLYIDANEVEGQEGQTAYVKYKFDSLEDARKFVQDVLDKSNAHNKNPSTIKGYSAQEDQQPPTPVAVDSINKSDDPNAVDIESVVFLNQEAAKKAAMRLANVFELSGFKMGVGGYRVEAIEDSPGSFHIRTTFKAENGKEQADKFRELLNSDDINLGENRFANIGTIPLAEKTIGGGEGAVKVSYFNDMRIFLKNNDKKSVMVSRGKSGEEGNEALNQESADLLANDMRAALDAAGIADVKVTSVERQKDGASNGKFFVQIKFGGQNGEEQAEKLRKYFDPAQLPPTIAAEKVVEKAEEKKPKKIDKASSVTGAVTPENVMTAKDGIAIGISGILAASLIIFGSVTAAPVGVVAIIGGLVGTGAVFDAISSVKKSSSPQPSR